MIFDNVMAFNRKLLFSAGDKYFTFYCLTQLTTGTGGCLGYLILKTVLPDCVTGRNDLLLSLLHTS